MKSYFLILLLSIPFWMKAQSKKQLLELAIETKQSNLSRLNRINTSIYNDSIKLIELQNQVKQWQLDKDSLNRIANLKNEEFTIKNHIADSLKRQLLTMRYKLDTSAMYLFQLEKMFQAYQSISSSISSNYYQEGDEYYENEDDDKIWQYLRLLKKSIDQIIPEARKENLLKSNALLYEFYTHQGDYNQAYNFASQDEEKAYCLQNICSSIYDELSELKENDAYQYQIDEVQDKYLVYYETLASLYPKSENFLNTWTLGRASDIYYDKEEYEKALTYSNLLISSCKPKDIAYYHYSDRANIYIMLEQYNLALKDIEKSMQLDKSKRTSLTYKEILKCKILIAAKRYNEALAYSERLYTLLPSQAKSSKFMSDNKAVILCLKAISLYKLGRISQADKLVEFMRLYYLCDEITLSIGDIIFDPCEYYDTYY